MTDAVAGLDVFSTLFDWNAGMGGNISLNTQYKASTYPNTSVGVCSGSLVVHNCSLRTATVQYPIIIDGNKSTVTLDPSTSIMDDSIININEYQYVDIPGPTYIGGIAFALNNRFKGTSHLRWVGAVGYELLSTGATGPQFAIIGDMESYGNIEDGCVIRFADPTQDLLSQARELMFRTALAFGNSSTVQVVAGTAARTTNVYRSHYGFLAGAVALTLVSILVVLATFNGYWRLGRSVSMSPIEIVKAFNASLLAAEDSNAEAKELVKSAGAQAVRYRLVPNVVEMSEDKIGSAGVLDAERTDMRLEVAQTRTAG